MNENPLVSVIIPAYNCEPYIQTTLDSALDQDYPNKEIIVVNDGSTDGTRAILDRYAERIRIIDQGNAGAAVARNTGLDAARGEFIAFLDADDYWLPGKLSAQVKYLQMHPDVGLVYCSWREWFANEKGEFVLPTAEHNVKIDLSIDPANSGWLYVELFKSCILASDTAMLRRDTVKAVGHFDPILRIGEDYDYWFRASRITQFHKLNAMFTLYRIHQSSITKKPLAVNYAAVVLQRALDRWGRTGPDGRETPKSVINEVMARIWFNFGYQHFKDGDPRLACDAFLRCLRYRPSRIKSWINLIRSFVAIFGPRI